MKLKALIRKKVRKALIEVDFRTKRFANIKADEIGTFYIVTNRLSDEDTLADIMFETDVFGFANQVRGGLAMEDVYGLYKNKNKATQAANMLIGYKYGKEI